MFRKYSIVGKQMAAPVPAIFLERFLQSRVVRAGFPSTVFASRGPANDAGRTGRITSLPVNVREPGPGPIVGRTPPRASIVARGKVLASVERLVSLLPITIALFIRVLRLIKKFNHLKPEQMLVLGRGAA